MYGFLTSEIYGHPMDHGPDLLWMWPKHHPKKQKRGQFKGKRHRLHEICWKPTIRMETLAAIFSARLGPGTIFFFWAHIVYS